MKRMNDKIFVDSNVFIYLLDKEIIKKQISLLLLHSNPVISTQVVGENIFVCLRKFKELDKLQVLKHGENLMEKCIVKPVTTETIKKAIEVCRKYKYSYWDSQIIASALENNCTELHSEDMQHNQLIENKLTIINPFL